jgi:hypothetical protein
VGRTSCASSFQGAAALSADFNAYLTKLYWQSRLRSLTLGYKDIKWSVIDWEEIRVLDHKDRAGLQLADVIAGAFYQAVEMNRGEAKECDPSCAKLLKPLIAARSNGWTIGYGLKPMPIPEAMHLVHPSGIEGLIFGSWGYAIRREASLRRSSGRAWPWWR